MHSFLFEFMTFAGAFLALIGVLATPPIRWVFSSLFGKPLGAWVTAIVVAAVHDEMNGKIAHTWRRIRRVEDELGLAPMQYFPGKVEGD
jgi:phosphatidylserine synthase|tara:strand:+ start:310 stop:576 length:267 start_codon:yes stop_codon:yes gene_type:complete